MLNHCAVLLCCKKKRMKVMDLGGNVFLQLTKQFKQVIKIQVLRCVEEVYSLILVLWDMSCMFQMLPDPTDMI